MNRQELSRAVAERVGISPKQADDALLAMTEIIGTVLTKGGNVQLVSFGKFFSTVRKPRESINPRNPAERCKVGPLRAVRFKPGLSLKKKIRLCQS